MATDLPQAQSLATQALIDYSHARTGGESTASGRAWIVATGVLGLIPSKLTELVANAAEAALHDTLAQTEEFYFDQLNQRGELTERVKVLADRAFAEFRSRSSKRMAAAFGKFENFVFSNCYGIEDNLVSGGWIRLPHHEGIDYTDLEDAAALRKEVATKEAALEQLLTSNLDLRHRIAEAEAWQEQLSELATVAEAIPPDFGEVARDASEASRSVKELITECYERIDDHRRRAREKKRPLLQQLLSRLQDDSFVDHNDRHGEEE